MAYSVGRLLAAFIPAGLLLVWVAIATPTQAAFAGMFVGLPLTLAITAAAAMRTSSTSPAESASAGVRVRRAALWPVGLVGAVATAAYWFRVWSYPGMEQWDLGGVLVLLYNILAFWWPALFVIMSASLLEGWLPRLPDASPFRRRLGTGLLGGLAGIILFAVGSSAYYGAYDRIPLEVDVTRRVGHLVSASQAAAGAKEPLGVLPPCDQVQAPPPPVMPGDGRIVISRSSPVPCVPPAPRSAQSAPMPRVPYRLDAGHLAIELEGQALAQASPYAALRSLEQAMESAKELLKRKDTAQVTLVVGMQPGRFGEILRFHADERDNARPVWELATLNRRLLKSGGRLEPGSLADMKEVSVRADFQQLERTMSFEVARDEVRIAFAPPRPLNADTASVYSSAWSTANKVLQEVVRYFPEIQQFRLDLPGLRTIVQTSEVHKGFRLQHRLRRPDRILGIIIRRGDPKQHPADPAFHLFDPRDGLQAAVVVFTGPLDAHIPGVLFEEVLLGPGLLYILDIDAGGSVTFLISDENRFQGPITIPAGGEKAVDGHTITNAGWLDASRFQRRQR